MKILEYKLELICLLLFTLCSSLWVLSLKEDKVTKAVLSPLLALEKVVPQHQLQLLNANFSDQLHYDQLAQVQSEVETLLFEVNGSESAAQIFKDYKETSLSYIQLTSMLKTSQRLISDNSQIESRVLLKAIDNIRLEMFSYIANPSSHDKAALVELVNGIQVDDTRQLNWRHIQLIKLHSLFVLDNYEIAKAQRQKLIEMPVIETIAQERAPLQQQLQQSTFKKYGGIFGTILSLVLLFVVVIKRNEHALKKTSDQHKEFATNLMDMLDSTGQKVVANPAHK